MKIPWVPGKKSWFQGWITVIENTTMIVIFEIVLHQLISSYYAIRARVDWKGISQTYLFCEGNTHPFSMVLTLNPALVTRSVSWLLNFHSLQVYGNRWTEWFWVWADIPTEERDGGVGTAHLAGRADARLGQIRLPVRYRRVKYTASLFPALILLGHICYEVWHLSHQHPVQSWELSLCGHCLFMGERRSAEWNGIW